MPNITNLRKTIGSHLGEVLTPEIAVAIEMAAHDGTDASIDPEQFLMGVCGGFTFQAERMGDILKDLHLLHIEHWRETEGHRAGLELKPDYRQMLADERAGRMVQFTVRERDTGLLVGNIRMYVLVSRHTQTLKAVEDTLYLSKRARGGMTALYFLRWVERCLRSLGVREIEADTKMVNRAEALMRRMKYTPVAIKFTKVFKEHDDVQ